MTTRLKDLVNTGQLIVMSIMAYSELLYSQFETGNIIPIRTINNFNLFQLSAGVTTPILVTDNIENVDWDEVVTFQEDLNESSS